jgi:hypothetical protein
VCYLCLDGGVDEVDQPLRRDCACRGTDSGFVHVSCLAKYAATKSEGVREMKEFCKPWVYCPHCRQEYRNELAVDIATEFVSFVRRQYPRDTQRRVESLYLKMYALILMFDRLQPEQKREAGVTADVILSLIDRLKGYASPLPIRYSHIKGAAYSALGRVALDEGTEVSARRAVVHFENQLQVSEGVDDREGIAAAKCNIYAAKTIYEGDTITEEMLQVFQDVYKLHAAEYGEEHEYTISAGKTYAAQLQKVKREDEARELLAKLLVSSKQILGPHHSVTKEVELVNTQLGVGI